MIQKYESCIGDLSEQQSVPQHGKDYYTVATRHNLFMKYFNNEASINTDIIPELCNDKQVAVKCTIYIKSKTYTGMALEIPKTNGKKNIKLDMQFDINRIRLAIKDINGLKALRDFKKENPELFDSNNMSVREYKQITDLYETRQIQLNTQGVTQ
jgi:hypothetical protein